MKRKYIKIPLRALALILAIAVLPLWGFSAIADAAPFAGAAEEYYESLSRRERMYIGIDKNRLKGIYEKYAIAQKLYNTLTQGINEEVSDDEARVIRIQQIFIRNEEVALRVQQK